MPETTLQTSVNALEHKLRRLAEQVSGLQATEQILTGAGDPSGILTAVQGTLYLRTGAVPELYMNISVAGTPPTGTLWRLIGTATASGITGGGTPGRIPEFTAATVIGDSLLAETLAGAILTLTGVLTGNRAVTVNDVDGRMALGAATLTAATGNDATIASHTHAITNTSDGDTNPSTLLSSDANGGLRLDRLGVNMAVPGGNGLIQASGDVYADNTTTAAHALNYRLELVSGDKAIGSYGYNVNQIKVPVTGWYAGAADGTAHDDMFVDNYAGGTGQWSVYGGCTPQGYNLITNPVSWAELASKRSADASPTHAVIASAVSGHTSGDYYWLRYLLNTALSVDPHRAGLVMMNSTGLTGAAIWIVYSSGAGGYYLEVATYSSVNAWLSQAGATTSNVAYTTDWTTRYTSPATPVEAYPSFPIALRLTTTLTQAYIFRNPYYSLSLQLSSTTFNFTPAYYCIFVEGNLSARGWFSIDFTGRNVL